MMDITDIRKIENDIILFNDRYFPGWRGLPEIFYSNAMAGEVGEFCNLTKKRAGGGTHNTEGIKDYELMMELADVLIYMWLWIESRGHCIDNLFGCLADKMKILEKRMRTKDGDG